MNTDPTDINSIVIIPARGGSKGIPRKNLRPLAGRPLIYYSIKAALGAKTISRVVVSTDDEEIALFAERFGASVLMRNAKLADDSTTLDPVVFDALRNAEKIYEERYNFVVTVQPTSPLVRSGDIDEAVTQLCKSELDSVLSVVDDRHLCWTLHDGHVKPAYKNRVNRQNLPPNYKETGAVIACTRKQLFTGSRIGSSVGIFEVPGERSFDIDSFADLYLCEALLSRKKIAITVVGYAEVGLGHAYRAVMLAHELVQYELIFVCEENSDLAIDYIRSNHYQVRVAKRGKLVEAVIDETPNLVINDILDTEEDYMNALLGKGIISVNFEDVGPGHKKAAVVINALYPSHERKDNVLVGPKYFCLRDEFLYFDRSVNKKMEKGDVGRVLITFGGVDEGNLTEKALVDIAPFCIEREISIDVVVGPGYSHKEELLAAMKRLSSLNCRLIGETKRISDYMYEADLAITSAGRTVFELAAMNVPMLVVCQNDREMTHTFASIENGIINLGHRKNFQAGKIADAFSRLVLDVSLRQDMKNKMNKLDLKSGKERVINLIKSHV